MKSKLIDEGHPECNSGLQRRATQSGQRLQNVMKEPLSRLERFLGLFADVRSGEGTGLVLQIVNLFLLLFAYYLLKTAREALILREGNAYIKSFSTAGQAALLILLVPFYGYVSTKVVRVRLVLVLLVFSVSSLLLFYSFGASGSREGVVFYIWVGIFNAFVISELWALANDIYTEGHGTRRFPVVGAAPAWACGWEHWALRDWSPYSRPALISSS